jgi:MFS family permease
MLVLRVFLPFACGYYVSYLYRTINAVIAGDLAADLGVAASALGVITSAYFIAFTFVQPPLGLALDRFGPRRVNAALLVLAGLAAIAFSFGTTVFELTLARALIGLGVAAALMSAMKAFSQWFPLDRLAAWNGWLLAVGGLGAISATAPVEAALALTDWRGVFRAVAALTFVVAGAVFFLVPDRPPAAATETWRELLRGLARVLGDGGFWRIALVCLTGLGPAIAIQGLWLVPWLRDVAGLDRPAAARALFAMTCAMTLGFWLTGMVTDRLRARGVSSTLVFLVLNALATATLATIVWGGVTSARAATTLWIAYNFLFTAGTLGFAILVRRFPAALAGRVNTSLNMVIFVAAWATQAGFGALLDLWPHAPGRHDPAAYAALLGGLAIAQVLALAWLLPSVRGRYDASHE